MLRNGCFVNFVSLAQDALIQWSNKNCSHWKLISICFHSQDGLCVPKNVQIYFDVALRSKCKSILPKAGRGSQLAFIESCHLIRILLSLSLVEKELLCHLSVLLWRFDNVWRFFLVFSLLVDACANREKLSHPAQHLLSPPSDNP